MGITDLLWIIAPFLILSLTIFVTLLLKNSVSRIEEDLRSKLKEINGINSALFARELLFFFGNSKTSRYVLEMLNENVDVDSIGKISEKSLDNVNEVKNLYEDMKNFLLPRIEFSKVSEMYRIIPGLIIAYGISLFSATFALYLFRTVIPVTKYLFVSEGVIVGSTLIFTITISAILIDVLHRTAKIKVSGGTSKSSS